MTSASALTQRTLSSMPDGQLCRIVRIESPDFAPHWQDWLQQIGFLPGECAMITRRSLPGGDPIAVRIGSSSFALRRAEADCIMVRPEGDTVLEAAP